MTKGWNVIAKYNGKIVRKRTFSTKKRAKKYKELVRANLKFNELLAEVKRYKPRYKSRKMRLTIKRSGI